MELTKDRVAQLWEEIDKLHSGAFDGWFGMGLEEWIEFGVTAFDTPEQTYVKVRDGINKKLEEKAYGWFMCEECGATDCQHIWNELTGIPEKMLKEYPQGKNTFGFPVQEKN